MLAVLVPARYPQMIARAAEYGNDRILMGAHYAMDVMGGRTLALYDLAHLLVNDPVYLGQSFEGAPVIKDFQAAVRAAHAGMTTALQTACGNTIAVCASEDIGRLSNPVANEAFYATTQTYNLSVVCAKNANTLEDVGKLAPEAGYPHCRPSEAERVDSHCIRTWLNGDRIISGEKDVDTVALACDRRPAKLLV